MTRVLAVAKGLKRVTLAFNAFAKGYRSLAIYMHNEGELTKYTTSGSPPILHTYRQTDNFVTLMGLRASQYNAMVP